MASINEVCKQIVDSVDNAFAAGVVDLNTGLLLGVYHNIPYFTQSYLDAVAAAAVDMFRGKGVSNVEKRLSQTRGEEVSNSLQEVQMTTHKTYHFMSVVPGKPNAIAVLITGKQANLGMGWAGLKNSMHELAPMCP
jgi:hypothetical protein